MNTTAHTVSPEDLMAFLDGELSASAAELVATHLAECEECAGVVTQFRNTSQGLSLWAVDEGLSGDSEIAIKELAADAAYAHRNAKREPWFRESGIRRLGVVAAGFAVVAAFLVWGMAISHNYRDRLFYAQYGPPTQAIRSSMQTDVDSKARVSRDSRALMLTRESSLSSADVERAAASNLYASKGAASPFASKIAPTTAPSQPMIARTVNLTMIVKDFAASRSALDQILARHHGYFAQLEVNTQEETPHNLTASLRIPAPDLASALAEIRSVGRVLSETQSGEEVTQQHQDLAIRLQNARETEERFRAILEQRTGKLADVLAVEESIARVRGEIEEMEAEQKTLEHRVDFATIEIQLSEEYKAQINIPDNSVSTRLYNAFVAGYHNASETILGIVTFLEEYGPAILIWLALLALPVLGWRRYRRLRSKL